MLPAGEPRLNLVPKHSTKLPGLEWAKHIQSNLNEVNKAQFKPLVIWDSCCVSAQNMFNSHPVLHDDVPDH